MIKVNLGKNILQLKIFEHEELELTSNQIFRSEHFEIQKDDTKGRFRIRVSLFNETELIQQIVLIGLHSDPNIFLENENFLLSDEKLILYFDGSILGFNISDLTLRWRIDGLMDIISVSPYEDNFIVYDELSILRIDKEGIIKWKYSGIDHFISYHGSNCFEMNDDHILLRDSLENVYCIDYDGRVIDDSDSRATSKAIKESMKKNKWNPFKK